MDFATTVFEYKWITLAYFEPLKGQKAPMDSESWQEHAAAGWTPCGASHSIPHIGKDFQGYIIFGMIKRERSRLVIPMDPPAAAGDVS